LNKGDSGYGKGITNMLKSELKNYEVMGDTFFNALPLWP
tara:strand:+ start:583 stop:699 length:117 start_codon:yes stop_codon:yes gene_type:complete